MGVSGIVIYFLVWSQDSIVSNVVNVTEDKSHFPTFVTPMVAFSLRVFVAAVEGFLENAR